MSYLKSEVHIRLHKVPQGPLLSINIYSTIHYAKKALFVNLKVSIFFILFHKNVLWVSIEMPCQGTSNDYP